MDYHFFSLKALVINPEGSLISSKEGYEEVWKQESTGHRPGRQTSQDGDSCEDKTIQWRMAVKFYEQWYIKFTVISSLSH